MQLSLAVDGIHCSYHLSGIDLVACLHIHGLHLTIECEIVSMADQHALIISRHYKHLFHDALEHRLGLCAL